MLFAFSQFLLPLASFKMRVLLLVLIYFVFCPLAGHYLGLFMIQMALSGSPANLITIYIVT